MLDRRTATWAELKERKEVHDTDFLSCRIGEPTYILSLELLGFREREAREELNTLKANM